MLYLIGTGIRSNLSLEVLEILKKCSKIYLENYTSVLQGNLDIGVEKVERDFVESYDVSNALKENIALLIIGDVFSATTHIALFNDCKEKNIKDKVLNIREGIEYLEKRGFKGKVVGCARVGSDDFVIKYGDSDKVKEENFGEGPYCIIAPSDNLHFMEEEVLRKWK